METSGSCPQIDAGRLATPSGRTQPRAMFVLPEGLAPGSAVEALAQRQAAVVRRHQLELTGLTNGQIDRMLSARRWQSDADGLVLVLHNGPLTPEQQESVAVLAGGRVCALAARTAATR